MALQKFPARLCSQIRAPVYNDMIKVNLFKHVKCPWSQKNVQKLVDLIDKKVKLSGELEIIVVGNATIKKINYKYRKKNKITDVLSFAWQEDKIIKSDYLGELYICYPQIIKQAKEFKISAKEEFIRMLTHGILHLAGYDHNTKSEEKIMFGIQEDIVKSFQS